MPKKIVLNNSNIERFLKENTQYIDNSAIIEHILALSETSRTLLLTRPSCFGKTLTFSLLKHFFSEANQQDTQHLKQLAIWAKNEALAKEHFGQYEVIHLLLTPLSSKRKDDFLFSFNDLIQDIFAEYEDFIPENSALYQKILDNEASEEDLIQSLAYLTQQLKKAGKKLILLIDEYDQPFYCAREDQPFIADFLHKFIQKSCVENTNIQFAVLGGIYRVVGLSEAIYHSSSLSTNDPLFSLVGFSEQDVSNSLEDFGIPPEELDSIKEWYGYEIDEKAWLFNPFSVLNYLETQKYQFYWTKCIGSCASTLQILLSAPLDAQIDFITLLRNGTLYQTVATETHFPVLHFDASIFYYLFLAQGFISIQKAELTDRGLKGELNIPNLELFHYLASATLKTFLDKNLEKTYSETYNVIFKLLEDLSDKTLKREVKNVYLALFWDALILYRDYKVNGLASLEKPEELISRFSLQSTIFLTEHPSELISEGNKHLMHFLENQKKYYQLNTYKFEPQHAFIAPNKQPQRSDGPDYTREGPTC